MARLRTAEERARYAVEQKEASIKKKHPPTATSTSTADAATVPLVRLFLTPRSRSQYAPQHALIPAHPFQSLSQENFTPSLSALSQMFDAQTPGELSVPNGWMLSGQVAGIPRIIYTNNTNYQALWIDMRLLKNQKGELPKIQTKFQQLNSEQHNEISSFVQEQKRLHMGKSSKLPIITPFYLSLKARLALTYIYRRINPNNTPNKYMKPSAEQRQKTVVLGNYFYHVLNSTLLRYLELYFKPNDNSQDSIQFQDLYNYAGSLTVPVPTSALNFFSGAPDKLEVTEVHQDQNIHINATTAIIGPSTRIFSTDQNDELKKYFNSKKSWQISATTEGEIAKQFGTLTIPTGFMAFWNGNNGVGNDLYHYAPVYAKDSKEERLALLLSGDLIEKD